MRDTRPPWDLETEEGGDGNTGKRGKTSEPTASRLAELKPGAGRTGGTPPTGRPERRDCHRFADSLDARPRKSRGASPPSSAAKRLPGGELGALIAGVDREARDQGSIRASIAGRVLRPAPAPRRDHLRAAKRRTCVPWPASTTSCCLMRGDAGDVAGNPVPATVTTRYRIVVHGRYSRQES